ncbi:glycosyltransferase family 4 protein [Patescibacteria group bacterium]|nr:glycosyltransferase family 4 protein [Patescibacteria group bacterium]MBU1705886.1 glycosyltransferase family 4 protein [Patescibacteria group bacterium]
MRIGIDAQTICDPEGKRGAGIEHYTWSIIYSLLRQAPDHEFVIFVPKVFSARLAEDLLAGVDNARLVKPFLPRVPLVSQHLLLPLRCLLSKIKVLFSPTGSAPLGWGGRSVITIHDLAIYDHPEWFNHTKQQWFATRIVVPYSIKCADRIMAVSEATQKQLHKKFPFSQSKTAVVYEGVNLPAKIENANVAEGIEDIVLFLGTIEPRKNLITTLTAFNQFLDMRPDRAPMTRLFLAGKIGWNSQETLEAIEKLNRKWAEQVPGGIVQTLGYVTEQEKWALLQEASVLFFPSLDEGFGLPVLEAMAVGIPVIASDRGSLPEIAGDTVYLIDPDDLEKLSLTLAQTLLVPQGLYEMVIAAQHRAKEFTWARAADQTLKIITSL